MSFRDIYKLGYEQVAENVFHLLLNNLINMICVDEKGEVLKQCTIRNVAPLRVLKHIAHLLDGKYTHTRVHNVCAYRNTEKGLVTIWVTADTGRKTTCSIEMSREWCDNVDAFGWTPWKVNKIHIQSIETLGEIVVRFDYKLRPYTTRRRYTLSNAVTKNIGALLALTRP